jgi:hypothetical protein
MKPLFIALLPIVLFLYFRATATASEYGKLTGIVTDIAGRTLSDAVIRLQNDRRTEGDIQGKFTLRKLAPGPYYAEIYCPGYFTTKVQFTIAAHSTTRLQATLAPNPVLPVEDSVLLQKSRRICGILRVAVNDNGFPIPGATVRILKTIRGAYSNQDGKATVLDVNQGSYTIEVKAIGFRTETRQVQIAAGSITDIDVNIFYESKYTGDPFGFPCPPPPLPDPGTIRVVTGEQLRRWP